MTTETVQSIIDEARNERSDGFTLAEKAEVKIDEA